MIIEILLTIQIIIIPLGFLALYLNLSDKVNSIEKKLISKTRGISKKDQENIKKFGEAIKTDVKNVWDSIDINDKVEALQGFDNFTQLANSNPQGLGSFMSNNILFDVILPMLQQAGQLDPNNIINMLNVRNVGLFAGGGIAYKIVKNILDKKMEQNYSHDEDKVPSHPERKKTNRDFPKFPEIP